VVPFVRLSLPVELDEVDHALLGRAVAGVMSEITGNSISDIHTIVDSVPTTAWSEGLRYTSEFPGEPPASDRRHATVSRVGLTHGQGAAYADLRREVVQPILAAQDGFVSSRLLRLTDGPTEYLRLDSWLALEHAQAFAIGKASASLAAQELAVLGQSWDVRPAEVVMAQPRRHWSGSIAPPTVLVRVSLMAGRDVPTKTRLVRELADVVSMAIPTSISHVNIIFDEISPEAWGRGTLLFSQRTRGPRPTWQRSALIHRVDFAADQGLAYEAFRREVVQPILAAQDGFIASMLLRLTDGPSEYLRVDYWLTPAHSQAFAATEASASLSAHEREILGRPWEVRPADVVHLAPA
jgi:phenylpyruvate tautomerase PptA (4-oxalocrotonate tautomerase family)